MAYSIPNSNPAGKSYRAMYKWQLAELAGVSTRTFARWLQHPIHAQALQAMGVSTRNKLLPPSAVRYIADTFCIEV